MKLEQKHPHILVVDDDVELGRMIQDYLKSQGYRTTVCTSPLEAGFWIQIHMNSDAGSADHVDLVLSDIRMTGMNGCDLTAMAKRLVPETPVILMTAFADASAWRKAMQSGARDLIVKPFSLSDLDTAMNSLLKAG